MKFLFYANISLIVFACLVLDRWRKFCSLSVQAGWIPEQEEETIVLASSSITTNPQQAESESRKEELIQATTEYDDMISPSAAAMFDCPLEPCHISIVFVGDSLTRFMYFSLAYFLRHNNTWIDPEEYPSWVVPRELLGGNKEHLYNWGPWFHASSQALQPYETCDCYRSQGSTTKSPGKDTICENRYYHDPQRNNTLVYLQARGHTMPLRGHWKDTRMAFATPPAHLLPKTKTTPTTAKEEKHKQEQEETINTAPPEGPHNQSYPFAWSYTDWSEALVHQVIQPLRPNLLVLNAGNFPSQFWVNPKLARTLQDITTRHVPHVVWKTTSSRQHGRYPPKIQQMDKFMCSLFPKCLDITSWTKPLPNRYYVDSVHFREPVYRAMNELLLRQVGILLGAKSNTMTSGLEQLGITSTT